MSRHYDGQEGTTNNGKRKVQHVDIISNTTPLKPRERETSSKMTIKQWSLLVFFVSVCKMGFFLVLIASIFVL
jgi:hypothetical protein